MANVAKRILTQSGLVWMSRAKRLMAGLFRGKVRVAKKYEFRDGYLVSAERLGKLGKITVADLPGYVVYPGLMRVFFPQAGGGSEGGHITNVMAATGHRDYFSPVFFPGQVVEPSVQPYRWEWVVVETASIPEQTVSLGLRTFRTHPRPHGLFGIDTTYQESHDGFFYNYQTPARPTQVAAELLPCRNASAASKVVLDEFGALTAAFPAGIREYTGALLYSPSVDTQLSGGQVIYSIDDEATAGPHVTARGQQPLLQGVPWRVDQDGAAAFPKATAEYVVAGQAVFQANTAYDAWGERRLFVGKLSVTAESPETDALLYQHQLSGFFTSGNTDVVAPEPERTPTLVAGPPDYYRRNEYYAIRYAHDFAGGLYLLPMFLNTTDEGEFLFADAAYYTPEDGAFARAKVMRRASGAEPSAGWNQFPHIDGVTTGDGACAEDNKAVFIPLPRDTSFRGAVICDQGSVATFEEPNTTDSFFVPGGGDLFSPGIAAGGCCYIGQGQFLFLASPSLPTTSADTIDLVAVVFTLADTSFQILGTVAEGLTRDELAGGLGRPQCIHPQTAGRGAVLLASFGHRRMAPPTPETGTGQTLLSFDGGGTWQPLSEEVGSAGAHYIGGKLYSAPAPSDTLQTGG